MINIERGTRQRALIKQGCYYMAYLMTSLRGNEGFMMNAVGVRHHITKGRYVRLGNFVIHLLGRFKGKIDEKMHLIPAVNRTDLGI